MQQKSSVTATSEAAPLSLDDLSVRPASLLEQALELPERSPDPDTVKVVVTRICSGCGKTECGVAERGECPWIIRETVIE